MSKIIAVGAHQEAKQMSSASYFINDLRPALSEKVDKIFANQLGSPISILIPVLLLRLFQPHPLLKMPMARILPQFILLSRNHVKQTRNGRSCRVFFPCV